MLSEFKTFIAKGNVLDLAIAVIIGAAFGAIVTSVVDDILMPIISLLTGGIDFTNLFIMLKSPPAGAAIATLKAAKEAGIPVLAYGNFIQQIINFFIVAFAIFLMVKQVNAMRSAPPPPDPTSKDCPFCATPIPLKATRCPHCTSELKA
jgi:large conductance mechanosensitive channel